MAVDYASYAHNEQIRQAADDNARNQYNQAKLRGEAEDRAQAAAKFAWEKTLGEAGLTGMYQGAYTMPTQQWFASNFGTWGTPTAGQQTLGAQQQQFGQGATLANMFGQYYGPGGGPAAGTQTQAAQQQAWAQQFAQQQEANRQAQLQQANAQQYLQLLSTLRGPADWFKYQQVLGATPGGMRDLVAAAAGQYIPGGGATTGMQPEAVSLQSMLGQVQQGQQNPFALQAYAGTPQAQPAGTAPRTAAYSGAPGTAQLTGYSTGPSGNINAQGEFVANPAQAQRAQATGGGTNTLGGATTPQYNLPAPNQIAAQSWKNLAPSQQQLMLGAYENQGWNKDDVTALMNQALPKYASNAPGAGTWRLQ